MRVAVPVSYPPVLAPFDGARVEVAHTRASRIAAAPKLSGPRSLRTQISKMRNLGFRV